MKYALECGTIMGDNSVSWQLYERYDSLCAATKEVARYPHVPWRVVESHVVWQQIPGTTN